jgi:hypothetical protein
MRHSHSQSRVLRWYLPAALGIWLISGAASALDCWVPTLDATQPAYRKMPLPNLRAVVAAGEQMVRDNPHFKAMPLPIRIRAHYAVSPSYGSLNVRASQPSVWKGTCELHSRALDCCTDGGINILVNAPEAVLHKVYADDEQLKIFRQPKETGMVAGLPSYEDRVLLSVGGRLPWLPVTIGEFIDFQERRERAKQAEALARRPKAPGIDPAVVQKTYEKMKRSHPAEAEQYRADMNAQMPALAEQHRKRIERDDQLAAERLAKIQQTRASFTPQQLASQAYHGSGPLNIARRDDPRAYGLVKPDPDFPDRRDPDRVQLITVFTSVIGDDTVLERRETMQRTKDTLDYARLEKFLQSRP